MLRFTVLLALAAAATCCAAFNLPVPDSVLQYRAANVDKVGRNLYFPCDAVSANHIQSLDLDRIAGDWFVTNTAFSISHKISPADMQDQISTFLGCVVDRFNTSSQSNKITLIDDTITRQPLPANTTLPPDSKLVGPNDIRTTRGAVLERQGDNGLWLLRRNLGNNFTLDSDIYLVSTDYTKYLIWYTCQDVPVPGTVDTVREQAWGISRRWPQNFNPVEIISLRLLALKNGIIDFDNLYTYPLDECTGPPPTTTTTTTTTTPAPTTTTTTTATTPTTTTATTPTTTTTTTETTPTTTTSTTTTTTTTTRRPSVAGTSFYQTFLSKVRNFHF